MSDTTVKYIHGGEWAVVGNLAVYPRDEDTPSIPTTYSIGRPEGTGGYRDLSKQMGYQNMQAAIDQAIWLVENPALLQALWWA